MRSKIISVITALLLSQTMTQASEIEYSGLVEVSTNTIVSSDTFSVTGTQGSPAIIVNEGLKDNSSFFMTVGGGFDATNRQFKCQLIGSYGKFKNGDLHSNILKLDASVYYIASQSNKFGIGAHIASLSFLSPAWSGVANLSLQGSNAIAPGLAIFFGDQFIIKASIDYVMGSKISVNQPAPGIVISDTSMNIDGVMTQIAVLYRF